MRKLLLLVCEALLAVSPLLAETYEPPAVAGTWFGTIVLTDAAGTVSHDTAVLLVEPSGSSFKGGLGRTIDQLTPWEGGSLAAGRLQFKLPVAGGLDVTLTEVRGHLLAGTATGKEIHAQIELRPAPGLLPHQQLLEEISAADRKLYKAFGNCDVVGYASLLSKDLEFYQDHTGKTGFEENLKALKDRCAEGIRLRRELDEESLIVNAAPGFGAIQAGTQRFYSRDKGGQEHLDATARFTNVWSKESGTWKLVRIISYDHQ